MRHPEYPEYELILSTKLKNAINKICNPNYYEFKLHNILINGQKRGCSGFIRNIWNGTTVYITTEPIYCGYMRRYALDTTDYSGKGGFNQYSKTLYDLAYDICCMLRKTQDINNHLIYH